MTEETPQQRPEGTTVNLPVQWQIPDDALASYATNFVVQRLQHEYLISFFQIQPPLLLGTPDQVVEQMSRLEKVPARLVAQVLIAEDRLQEFEELLQRAPALTAATDTPVPPITGAAQE
jgi:hypothetical protein